jgi:3-methyl-2-oxobutanoate hydroxymethyltransferase
VPSSLAREITHAHPQMLSIGIGAGAGTTGQVLVLHDLLGITPGKRPRFVRDFTRVPGTAASAAGLSIAQAVQAYVQDVKSGSFPDETIHGY